MNRRALITAIGFAVLGILIVWHSINKFEEEASGGPEVAVVIAIADIPMGATINDAMLGSRRMPQKYVDSRHVQTTDHAKIMGVVVRNEVRANEPVLWTDLITSSEGGRKNLANMIPAGNRAMTISADATSGFGGLLQPGDRVDVMLTAQDPTAGARTITLLQNLLVLAVGQDLGGPSAGVEQQGRRSSEVTLSVTIEQTQLLALAQQQGRLALVMRNPDDIQLVQALPEATPRDIIEPARLERIQQRTRVRSAPVQAPEPPQPEVPQRVE